MSRGRLQALVLLGLLGVMVGVYARALRPSSRSMSESRRSPRPPAAPPGGPVVGAPAARTPVPSSRRPAQRALAQTLAWQRDPFGRGVEVGPTGGFSLSGILWDAQDPIAIVNNEELRVGETLDGFRVTEIAADHVTLSDGTQTHRLRINP